MNPLSDDNLQHSNSPFKKSHSAQLAWSFNIDAYHTRIMGGVLAEQNDNVDGIHDVLDIACASGGWALEFAHLYPHITVTGVDENKAQIEYVRAHAKAQNIKNVHYQTINILEPLPFADGSFDLVNARSLLLKLALKSHDWPVLIQECWRILRPGGILRLTEMERHFTNNAAQERLWDLLAQILFINKYSFSPDGRHLGMIPHLGRLLREAGFLHIHNHASTSEISPHSPDFSTWREIDTFAWIFLEDFFIQSGLVTAEELQRWQVEALQGSLSEDFCAKAAYPKIFAPLYSSSLVGTKNHHNENIFPIET